MTAPKNLEALFSRTRAEGRAAFCPYFVTGFPDPATSTRAVVAAAESGADIIEVGMPFSDPLADGPTIQAASQVALDAGVKVEHAFEHVRAIRGSGPTLPVLMTYFNLVHNCGVEAFLDRALEAGSAGLIIPDLPLEEADLVRTEARRREIDLIALIAPTTPDSRLSRISAGASGFLYLVSVTGVTGARQDLSASLESYLARVRSQTGLPLCVGFGISSPAQASRVARAADGVIVGSALVSCIEEAREGPDEAGPAIERAVRELVSEFAEAVRA